MTAAAQETVSKLEYARMRQRDPSAVSHWIKHGKLKAPALVGDGRKARIVPGLADQMLGGSLSLGHQVGYAIREPDRAIIVPPAADSSPETITDQARLLRARADREEIARHQAFAAEQERNGAWIDRAASDREHGKRLAETIASIERGLPQLANRIAAEFGGDVRAMTVTMRAWFRELRAGLAAAAREQAAPP